MHEVRKAREPGERTNCFRVALGPFTPRGRAVHTAETACPRVDPLLRTRACAVIFVRVSAKSRYVDLRHFGTVTLL